MDTACMNIQIQYCRMLRTDLSLENLLQSVRFLYSVSYIVDQLAIIGHLRVVAIR